MSSLYHPAMAELTRACILACSKFSFLFCIYVSLFFSSEMLFKICASSLCVFLFVFLYALNSAAHIPLADWPQTQIHTAETYCKAWCKVSRHTALYVNYAGNQAKRRSQFHTNYFCLCVTSLRTLINLKRKTAKKAETKKKTYTRNAKK